MSVITVAQLNRYVKMMLEEDPHLTPVYVRGEISNFVNHYKSGHLYFSLKDETALVKAVMFRTYASRLKFKPENGMTVIVRARVSLYEKDGAYQLYVEDMQPDGIGALQLAYEQLKQRLEEEGLFDPARKKPLPAYPERVGVITSPTGAAVRDMLNILGRRFPLAKVVFMQVLVQGEDAPAQLADALARMNRERSADVILIGRGGGSLEELWAFNTELVCRAVAASEIPVISGVGHETDFTLCDFSADLRAPTPSAAAELAVPDGQALLHKLARTEEQLQLLLTADIQKKAAALTALRAKKALSSPGYFVEQAAMRLDYLTQGFSHRAQAMLTGAHTRLAAAAARLDALSPLAVLSRGYAIPQDTGGAVLRTVSAVGSGDAVQIRMQDGRLHCTVDRVEPNEQEEM